MRLYFVALIPPEEVVIQITAYKKFMHAQFEASVALRSPPHITLVPPFLFSENEADSLIHSLNLAAKKNHKFPIELKGFGYFTTNTIFIEVVRSHDLFKLYTIYTEYFEVYLKRNKIHKNSFHPHITIANRDLTNTKFTAAWSVFSQKEFNAVFEAQQISLLKHNGKSWDILSSALLAK